MHTYSTFQPAHSQSFINNWRRVPRPCFNIRIMVSALAHWRRGARSWNWRAGEYFWNPHTPLTAAKTLIPTRWCGLSALSHTVWFINVTQSSPERCWKKLKLVARNAPRNEEAVMCALLGSSKCQPSIRAKFAVSAFGEPLCTKQQRIRDVTLLWRAPWHGGLTCGVSLRLCRASKVWARI